MAVTINGAGNHYHIPLSGGLALRQAPWCIAVWARVPTSGSQGGIAFYARTPSTSAEFFVRLQYNNLLSSLECLCSFANGTIPPPPPPWVPPPPPYLFVSETFANDNAWRLFVYQQLTNGTQEIWVADRSGNISSNNRIAKPDIVIDSTDLEYYIGHAPLSTPEYFNGDIAEFFTGRFSLTQVQIEALVAGYTPPQIGKSPLTWMRFNDTSSPVADLGLMGHEAALTGAVTAVPFTLPEQRAFDVSYVVQVDWDRNGNYSGAYDDITQYVIGATWNVGFRQPFQDVASESQLMVTLNNSDGRFSPEHSASAVYGSYWQMRPIRVQATYAGGTVTLWTGWTRDIQPTFGFEGTTATLTAVGGRNWFENVNISAPLMEGYRSDQILSEIVAHVVVPQAAAVGPWVLGRAGNSELGTTTALGGSSLVSQFDTGAQTFVYAGDTWQNRISALEAIEDVVRAERGRFYLDRQARMVFWNRQRLILNTHLTAYVAGTMQGMEYVYGANLANTVLVSVTPRTLGAGPSDVLWRLENAIKIPARGEKTISVRFNEQNSGVQIAGLDVVSPSRDDSSFITSHLGATIRGFSAQATGAEIWLHNEWPVDATVTTLIVRGRKLATFNQVVIEVSDQGSAFDYGRHTYNLDLPLLDDESMGRSIAHYEIARRKRPRGEALSVTLLIRDSLSAANVLERVVGERVRVSDARTGHDGQYHIVGEEHHLVPGKGMRHHEARWVLESAVTTTFWMLGRAGQSELGASARLGL